MMETNEKSFNLSGVLKKVLYKNDETKKIKQKYFNKKEKLEQMERDLREANNISAAPRKRCILKEVETNCGSPALELRQNYNGSKLQNKSNQWNILE